MLKEDKYYDFDEMNEVLNGVVDMAKLCVSKGMYDVYYKVEVKTDHDGFDMIIWLRVFKSECEAQIQMHSSGEIDIYKISNDDFSIKYNRSVSIDFK